MAVRDIRLAIGFLDHPKTIKLERLFGAEGIKCLLRLWFYAAEYKPGGILENMDEEDVEIAAKWTGEPGKFIEGLINIRWVVPHTTKSGTVFKLHDWEDHQGFVVFAKQRSDQARRAAKTRWEKKHGINDDADSNTDSKQSAMLSNAERNAPIPTPTPTPIPTHFKKGRRINNMTDDEWFEMIKQNQAYQGIDFEIEKGKCEVWCQTVRRKFTRRTFINWLNKVERPIILPGKESKRDQRAGFWVDKEGKKRNLDGSYYDEKEEVL